MGAKCESCGAENAEWVPLARYNGVAKARDDAQARAQRLEDEAKQAATDHQTALADVQSKLDALGDPASQVETLTTQLQEAHGELEASKLRQGLMMGGVMDPEGLEVAATLWGALPADKRPESVEAWLADGAPRAVTVYVGSAGASGGQEAGGDAGGAGDGQQGANGSHQSSGGGFTPTGGKGGSGGQNGTMTPEQIAAMGREEFQEFLKNNPAGIR